jgi:hypothetical protein
MSHLGKMCHLNISMTRLLWLSSKFTIHNRIKINQLQKQSSLAYVDIDPISPWIRESAAHVHGSQSNTHAQRFSSKLKAERQTLGRDFTEKLRGESTIMNLRRNYEHLFSSTFKNLFYKKGLNCEQRCGV